MALAACLVVGCTGGAGEDISPAPTGVASETSIVPTRVAVVLPPLGAPAEDIAQLRRSIDSVVASSARNVELRFVQPDGPEFVGDVAAVLAGDGWDLVCVLHPVGVEDVAAVAARLPGTHFCVDSSRAIESPANLWAPRPRYAETSFLVGVAAGLVARGGVVAALVREGQPALAVKRAALTNGHASVPAPNRSGAVAGPTEGETPAEVVAPIVGTLSQQEQDIGPIVEAILSQEPRAIVVDVGPLVDEVVARVVAALPDVPLIVWADDVPTADLPDNAIVVDRNRTVVFRLAFDALLAGGYQDLPDTIGVNEGIHRMRTSSDSLRAVLEQLEAWTDRIASGELDVTQTGE